jgi:hypothetical protein
MPHHVHETASTRSNLRARPRSRHRITVTFSASNAPARVTGQILRVDGGFSTGAARAIP